MAVLIYTKKSLGFASLSDLIKSYGVDGEKISVVHSGRLIAQFDDISSHFDLNQEAVRLRKSYIDTVASINDTFLQSNLLINEEYSWFFLSDSSCKRTEVNKSFSLLCEASLIGRIARQKKITKIILHETSNELIKQLKCVEIVEKEEGVKKKAVKNWGSLIKFVVSAMISLLWLKFISKSDLTEELELKEKKVFLTRYPLHFNVNEEEEKYGDLVSNKDVYLVNLLTDGMHQYLSPIAFARAVRNVSQNKKFYLLDRHLSIYSFLYCLVIPFKQCRLIDENWTDNYIISGLNISQLLLGEVHQSIFRYARYWPYLHSLPRFFSKADIKDFIYYIHEYSFGRVFAYILRSNCPETKLIGMQHGPASLRKLLYFLSEGEVAKQPFSVNSIALPEEIWAEDENSKRVYEKAGYKNVNVLSEVPRLSYLGNIRRKPKVGAVLVAPGLHDGEFVINYVNSIAADTEESNYYVVKFHPRSNVKMLIKLLDVRDNISVSEAHISELLSIAETVICTYSSVGLEAKALGIETKILTQPGYLNESPLLDGDYEDI